MKNLFIFLLPLVLLSCNSVVGTTPVYRSSVPSKADESKEFAELMELDKKDKLQRAADAVNQFVNDSPTDPNAAILIKNETRYNIIVRINGTYGNYRVPVPKGDKNYILLKKGSYIFKSQFCDAKYFSDKTVTESITLTLTERYQ